MLCRGKTTKIYFYVPYCRERGEMFMEWIVARGFPELTAELIQWRAVSKRIRQSIDSQQDLWYALLYYKLGLPLLVAAPAPHAMVPGMCVLHTYGGEHAHYGPHPRPPRDAELWGRFFQRPIARGTYGDIYRTQHDAAGAGVRLQKFFFRICQSQENRCKLHAIDTTKARLEAETTRIAVLERRLTFARNRAEGFAENQRVAENLAQNLCHYNYDFSPSAAAGGNGGDGRQVILLD